MATLNREQTHMLFAMRDLSFWQVVNCAYPAPPSGCDPYLELMTVYENLETDIENSEESFGVDMHNAEIQLYEDPGRLTINDTRPNY